MRKLENTNHNPPQGYELFLDAKDTSGRTWKLAALPMHGGTCAFFDKLGEYVRWCKQVEEIRDIQAGKETVKERVMRYVNEGQIDWPIAERMIG